MADWNGPTITTNYLQFVTEMNAKFYESARMYFDNPNTLPIGTVRFNRSGFLFEEWDANQQIWIPRQIGVAGGGTGSSNPAGIRVNLGLGSMSTQNANAVAITGGTITGVTYSASDINTGVMALARGGTGNSLSLGPQGTVLGSFSGVVQFSSGVNIAELNANALTVGSVPKARLPATVVFTDQNNSIGGTTQLSDTIITSYGAGVNNFAVRSVYPLMNWDETQNVAGTRNMRMIYSGGALIWQAAAPDWSSSANVMILRHGGQLEVYGGLINNLNASYIAAGRVGQQFLGGGAYDTSTFLRGDGNWAVPPTGGSGGGTPIPFPSGMISMFATGCPAGWTRVAQFDGRFPTGSTVYGQQGGNSRHSHSFSVNTSTDGRHSHSFSGGLSGNATGNVSGTTGNDDNTRLEIDGGNSGTAARGPHGHSFNVSVNLGLNGSASGETAQAGDHYHQVSGTVTEADIYPPYTTVIFCQKD